ncbi:OmpA family protein [Candidatus Parabeggiatoa sp. HSG14]|uniref:OmpA/MotB family protein n=1 Tax=Candidatus Parabeggiatoa sp. HSG14 TaxID=3055593 RepID=UPI0025A76A55|nr:OmpA family protein [Thiotrichales bacterium HSG14]
MKNLQSFLVEDNNVFGPGTDLVVSLAAVLIILFAVYTQLFQEELAKYKELKIEYQNCKLTEQELKTLFKDLQELFKNIYKKYQNCEKTKEELQRIIQNSEIGQIDIKEVKKNQMEIVNKIADEYGRKPKINENDENRYGISTIPPHTTEEIIIQNDVTIQRISFGSHILFNSDKTALNKDGKQVLTVVGNIFKEKLETIKEIQIQGHADSRKSRNFSSNLQLAALRAIEVFKHFQDLGIDPHSYIMSATSFGEYKPVQRNYSDKYNKNKLKEHNDTDEELKQNRRIEVVLIYRRKY